MSALDHDGGRDLLGGAVAIRVESIGREVAESGVTAEETDGPIVDELCKRDTWIQVARPLYARLVRELSSPPGLQIEEDDLRRLVSGGVRTEVDERDAPAVGTDRKEPPGLQVELQAAEMDAAENDRVVGGQESPRHAARRPDPPEPAPVGAHEEDTFPTSYLGGADWRR